MTDTSQPVRKANVALNQDAAGLLDLQATLDAVIGFRPPFTNNVLTGAQRHALRVSLEEDIRLRLDNIKFVASDPSRWR